MSDFAAAAKDLSKQGKFRPKLVYVSLDSQRPHNLCVMHARTSTCAHVNAGWVIKVEGKARRQNGRDEDTATERDTA